MRIATSRLCRLLAVALLALACAGRPAPIVAPADPDAPPRLLVFALDAVPFAEVEQMSRDGAFAAFHPPARLVSSFPSATSLAMSGILAPLGLKPPDGYEARFFDRSRNRIRGGGLFSYNRLKFPWRSAWDWKAGNVRKIVSGIAPVHASLTAIGDVLAAFAASDDPVFLAYTDATDLAGHLKSPESLSRILRRLDEGIATLRREHPERPFHVVLFSDHGQAGGQPLVNLRKPVRRALQRAGYRLRGSIGGPEDVVLVPYGLLSAVIAYTEDAAAEAVAGVLASIEGVDLCVASDGEPDRWRVLDAAGDALVERRMTPDGGQAWRYRVGSSDPLDLAALVAGKAASWNHDAWWRARTKSHQYPDPLYRIAGGFENVANPASVICSLDTTAMYGSLLTTVSSRLSIGRLEWTHGSLHRAPSLGFLLTDLPGWNEANPIRFDRALGSVADYARDAFGLDRVVVKKPTTVSGSER